MLFTLVRHTDNAQMSFATVGVCQPVDAAIFFPKSWNFELKNVLVNLLLETMTSVWFCIHFWSKKSQNGRNMQSENILGS